MHTSGCVYVWYEGPLQKIEHYMEHDVKWSYRYFEFRRLPKWCNLDRWHLHILGSIEGPTPLFSFNRDPD
jgi:hypothetical protein